MSYWQPYLIAIVVGLMVGIEREKAHPHGKAMGVRTFLMLSLMGALAGGLDQPILSAFITLFALSLIVISYTRQAAVPDSDSEQGLTTEFAAGVIYCLGFAAHSHPELAAVIGPIVAVVLFSKSVLHRFSHALKPSELQAALFLLLIGMVVLNLVPDQTIDPWKIFNPRKFGFLILALAVLEFSSYVLAKVIGEKKGSYIVGFLGGLVSSTAVLYSSAKQAAKNPAGWRNFLCSALAAKIASLLEVLVIVGFVSPPLLSRIALSVGAAIAVGIIALYIVSYKRDDSQLETALKSPLDWKGVIRLSLMLGTILVVVSIAELWLGDQAMFIVSFVTGLFELRGVTVANSTMFTEAQLSLNAAAMGVALAVAASMVAKIALAWGLAKGTFAWVLTLIFIPMIAIVGLTAWLDPLKN